MFFVLKIFRIFGLTKTLIFNNRARKTVSRFVSSIIQSVINNKTVYIFCQNISISKNSGDVQDHNMIFFGTISWNFRQLLTFLGIFSSYLHYLEFSHQIFSSVIRNMQTHTKCAHLQNLLNLSTLITSDLLLIEQNRFQHKPMHLFFFVDAHHAQIISSGYGSAVLFRIILAVAMIKKSEFLSLHS